MQDYLTALLPGLGTVALAILSGAGGSAILELWWKPRRDRRKAAGLLLADVLLNTDLLLLQAHARFKNPRSIPADFQMSVMGWDSAAQVLSELDPELLKSLVLLYNRYRYLNRCVELYAEALREQDAMPKTDPRYPRVQRHLEITIDVFNTAIDNTIDDGKKILPRLLAGAGIKEPKTKPTEVRNYQDLVDKLIAEREGRLRGLAGGKD
ncbi:MAG: hypothetical protein JNJ80_25965 [Gemmatimonadetes bacterium]|nr:hypothetical protein [Gemmatimonadota bacterium]